MITPKDISLKGLEGFRVNKAIKVDLSYDIYSERDIKQYLAGLLNKMLEEIEKSKLNYHLIDLSENQRRFNEGLKKAKDIIEKVKNV